jgi:Tfp pilus assembly protein PilZ
MNTADGMRTVMVLAERPDDAGAAVIAPWLAPVRLASAEELAAALHGRRMAGFVLDVELVLRARPSVRELLYHLAQAFPLLRLLRKGPDVSYLDDPAAFRAAVRAFSPRAARNEPRVPVFLRGRLGGTEGAADALEAAILDLSRHGGLLSAMRPLADEFALRILDLEDRRPVTARVLWRRAAGRNVRHGAGVRFLDLRPGQERELAERFLGQAAEGAA